MKRYISNFILPVLIIVFSSPLYVNTFQFPSFAVPTDQDYKLSISESNIPTLKDTIFGGNKCLVTECPLTLTSNTSDTLRYARMSVSWWDIYSVDNKDFSLAADYWNVFKNGATVYVLPPHQFITTNIKIITYKDYCRGEAIKIAMHIQKVLHIPQVGDIKSISSNSNFIIWSNEVTIH